MPHGCSTAITFQPVIPMDSLREHRWTSTINLQRGRRCNLRKASWNSLAAGFKRKGYVHAEAVGRFVERAEQELCPTALILFGSLARGDFHQYSDADFCVVLSDALPSPFGGYDRVVAFDPSGLVQPVVYDVNSFRKLVQQASAMALEHGRRTFSRRRRRFLARDRAIGRAHPPPSGYSADTHGLAHRAAGFDRT